MSFAVPCPYPDCPRPSLPGATGPVCACELQQPLVSCGVCGLGNRLAAYVCRRCRAELPQATTFSPDARPGGVSLLAFAGTFRRPPLAMHDTAYAVSTAGHVQSLVLRNGTAPRVLAELPPAAGFNRAALVRAAVTRQALPASCLLGAHPGGIEAVVLATGEVRSVYAARSTAELAVNGEGAASGFRGVAADASCVAFAEHHAAGQITVAVQFFASSRPVERPLTLAGREIAGPILHDRLVAACSEEEVGVFDLADETAAQVQWPRTFEPLLARRPEGIHVPPGSTPLSAERTGKGVVVFVGGFEGGVPGVLRVEMETRSFGFVPLGQGASLTSNTDGSLCVAAEDEVWVLGREALPRERAPLQPGMPAVFASPLLAYFVDEPRMGSQRLRVAVPGKQTVANLRWDDPACTPATCCPPLVSGGGVSVPYLALPAAGSETSATNGAGLKVAHWTFAA